MFVTQVCLPHKVAFLFPFLLCTVLPILIPALQWSMSMCNNMSIITSHMQAISILRYLPWPVLQSWCSQHGFLELSLNKKLFTHVWYQNRHAYSMVKCSCNAHFRRAQNMHHNKGSKSSLGKLSRTPHLFLETGFACRPCGTTGQGPQVHTAPILPVRRHFRHQQ